MDVQINIKNPEAHRLAAELSRLTGESMSQAVTKAIRDRLTAERQRRQSARAGIGAKLRAIGAEVTALPLLDERSADEILYDEDGLPRR